MSRETSFPVDRVPTPEIKTYQEGYTAFKVRVLLGGAALNPDHQLRKEDITQPALGVTEETKQDITKVVEAANHNPLANASDAQRLREAGVARDQLEAEYNRRSQTFHTILKGDYAEDWNSFMDTFVQKITGKTRDQITVADVRGIYDRYFTGADKHAEVKTYIKDIMALYSKNGKIDYEALKRDREKIQYMAAIFGKEKDEETGGSADEAIAQLIEGHAEIFVNPDGFINQATQEQNGTIRANAFAQGNGKNEKGLQQWLWKYGQPIDIPQPQPIIKTPDPIPTTPLSKIDSPFILPSWPDSYWPKEPKVDGKPRSYYQSSTETPLFPNRDLAEKLTNPYYIAGLIKVDNQDKYKDVNVMDLGKQIEKELQQVTAEFNSLGLDAEGISQNILKQLQSYLTFVNAKYLHEHQAKTPNLGNIKILPYSGRAREAFVGHENSYAFVMDGVPAVFVNVDRIKQHAAYFLNNGKSYDQMSPKERQLVFNRALSEVYPHEFTHLTESTGYLIKTEKDDTGKDTTISHPVRLGIQVNKTIPVMIDGEQHAQLLVRGQELNEAVVVQLMEEWAKDTGKKLQLPAYTAEREVLNKLLEMMAKEQNIDTKTIFSQFVRGHYSPQGFRELIQNLSGPKNQEGKRPRPYFASIIYGLMNYEQTKYLTQYKDTPTNQRPEFNYDLTMAYLNNSLTDAQRTQLKDIIVTPPDYENSDLYFPYSARRELGAQLGIDLPSLATKSQ